MQGFASSTPRSDGARSRGATEASSASSFQSETTPRCAPGWLGSIPKHARRLHRKRSKRPSQTFDDYSMVTSRILSRIDLDMSAVPDFEQRVYAETRSIPPGETLTYGDIATRLGDVGLSRAVGQALGRNPFAIVVPCHRVLAAGGKSGGFSAVGGVDTKRRLLEIEGARDLHRRCPGTRSAKPRMPAVSHWSWRCCCLPRLPPKRLPYM